MMPLSVYPPDVQFVNVIVKGVLVYAELRVSLPVHDALPPEVIGPPVICGHEVVWGRAD
jgi:hypothetical protein